MNITIDDDTQDLRYAEYVLGVLDAAGRAQVQQEIARDAQAAATVAQWERHLLPLAEDLPPVTPGDYVWVRIRDALGLTAARPVAANRSPAAATAEGGWWNSLALWRWLGMGATAAAAVCLVLLLQTQQPVGTSEQTTASAPAQAPAPAPAPAPASYMVATIQQDNGITGWTATMDLQNHRMIVVPASPAAVPHGHSPELWLIPPGGKPMAVGVIASDKPTSVALSPDLFAKLSAQSLLAVSVEPAGGSPTGQPTGPVVAKGTISGA